MTTNLSFQIDLSSGTTLSESGGSLEPEFVASESVCDRYQSEWDQKDGNAVYYEVSETIKNYLKSVKMLRNVSFENKLGKVSGALTVSYMHIKNVH